MTAYRKKLIEVALPLEAINVESAREKSIRHGHPSTLHLWWARQFVLHAPEQSARPYNVGIPKRLAGVNDTGSVSAL